jgi:hypothetical protein
LQGVRIELVLLRFAQLCPRQIEARFRRGDFTFGGHALLLRQSCRFSRVGREIRLMDPSSYAVAMSLSTAAGIRPFLTLAICALMMYAGYLHPSPQFAWLGSPGDAILLSFLALLEFGSDKIPILDHAMHVVHFATKPIAAVIIAGSTIPAGDPHVATYVTMGIAALNALGIHTALAGTRAASTTATLGLANPVVSFIEDIVAVFGIVIAFALPFLGLAISVVVIVVIYRCAALVRKATR